MKNRAVLLANLGSPISPDIKDVRKYLKQFLMDPYVIHLPWLIRAILVNLLILPFRPKKSAKAYRSVWMNDGSPLVVLSMQLLAAIKNKTNIPVAMSMRYGSPSIESQLLDLATQDGINEILFIPLYPHFAESTVTTSINEAKRVIQENSLDVKLLIHKSFYDDEAYINALVNSAKPFLENKSSFDHILFSYHGLPELHISKADPTGEHCLKKENCCSISSPPSPAHSSCYRHQVLRTTQCFVNKTGLTPEQYSVSFQSRLG